MRALWRRKIRIGRSPGISTVIGAIFFVIITLLITTNIFLWSIAQHNQYNQVVIQCNQMDADRINERIIVDNGNYSIASPYVKVNATLVNGGPIASQIISLWVIDNTIDNYGYTSFSSSPINLDPGEEWRINKSVTIPECQTYHSYDIWVVTARGNRIPIEQNEYVTFILQMMGPVQVKFGSIRWRSAEDGSSGTYQIPKVIWSIDVINYGFQDIHLNNTSAFLVDTPREKEEVKVKSFYIDHEYALPAGKTVTLEFWRKLPGDKDYEKEFKEAGINPVTVTLVGYYDDVPTALFGAAITGQAIQVTEVKK